MASNQTTTVKSGGIGFCGLLAILFITLKLVGVVTWSWLWVLSPLWMPLAIVLGVIFAALVITVCIGMATGKK